MSKLLSLSVVIVMLGLAAVLTVPALVQAAPGGHQAGGGRVKKLAADLGLTPAQKTQLAPMLRDARAQAKTIKADTGLTPEAKQDKLKALRRSTKQKMMTVLTPDQIQKMKDLRQQRRAAKNNNT